MEKSSIKSVAKVCIIYVFFSVVWIAFSDKLIYWLISDPRIITTLQTYKGGGFIVATSALLYYLISREMTARERLEEEIKAKNKELKAINTSLHNEIEEHKNTERELTAAKEGLELANKAKSQFLANMSHEIRTPMSGIMGVIDILNLTELSEEQRKYLGMIKTSSESMLGIINDILDISRIEAGKIELEEEEFRLEELVQKCVEAFELAARCKGIRLSCDMAPDIGGSLVGDDGRLKQILMNLISNAVKFTVSGEVSIKVEKLAEEKDSVILKFTVRDTGIGIAADKIRIIFDSFSQADASYSRKYGGAGLGLAISKKLVELMGGYIGVNTRAGEGSTFYFTVPFRLGNMSAEGYAHSRTELRGLRVLVADDDEQNREILKSIFREWGASVTIAENGGRMYELLEENAAKDKKFDILLLDFYMPCVNGIQCGEGLRKQPEYRDLTVMLVASVDSADSVRLMREMDDCLYAVKPMKRRELYDAVMRALMENRKRQKGSGAYHEKRYSNKKVLVAEDNEINQKTVAIMLEAAGLYVDMASNGREAVQMFESGSYDLILMDVQMPEMDGLHAAAGIRRLPKGSAVPIIALTAHVLKGDMEKCLEAGMNDYLPKPYTTKELYQKLETYLGPVLAG